MYIFNSCASTIESYFPTQTYINNIVTTIVKVALEAMQSFVELIRCSYQSLSNIFKKSTPHSSQNDAPTLDELQQQIIQLKKRILNLEAGVEVATLFFEDLDECPIVQFQQQITQLKNRVIELEPLSDEETIALKRRNEELEYLNTRLERRNARLQRQINRLEDYKAELTWKNKIYLETIDEQEEIMLEYEEELLAQEQIIYDLNEFYEKVTTFQKVESTLTKKINSKIPREPIVEDKENNPSTPQKGRNRVNSTSCAQKDVSVLALRDLNISSHGQ